MTGSRGESDQQRVFTKTVEADPMGVNVGTEDPFINPHPAGFQPEPHGPMLGGFEESCSGSNPSCGECYLDGMPLGNCARVFLLVEMGVATPCPGNDCRPRTVLDSQGRRVLSPVQFDPKTGELGYWGYEYREINPDYYRSGAGEDGIDVSGGSTDLVNVWHFSDRYSFFSYGWKLLPSQSQNSERRLTPHEVQKLRDGVQQILTQKCKDFIRDVINKAAEQTPSNPAHSRDIMELFEQIQSQEGFAYRPGWATVSGYIHTRDARVILGGYQPIRSVANQLADVFTAIHEIMHQAGKNWYYDKDLARAIIAIRQARGLSVDKTPEEIEYMLRRTTSEGVASSFWDKYLREACGGLK